MFPPDWTEKKTIEKSLEAYNNSVLISADKYGEVFEGVTKEGIKIRLFITYSRMLKTPFPIF